MSSEVFWYFGIGKLIIFLAQKFPLFRDTSNKFFKELLGCDLCLGVWVYTGLAFVFVVEFPGIPHVPGLYEFFVGALSSFLMHLLTLGWNSKFQIINLE